MRLSQKINRNRRQRHSFPRRLQWWIREKWRAFKLMPLWKKILFIGGPILVFVIIIPALMFLYFTATMGDMENLMNRNNTGVVLKDINDKTFYSTGTAEHRSLVKLDQISDYTEKALIASEDKNFYDHGGVSIFATIRAIYGYVLSGGGEFGGSTLTQQLAKMTVLSTDRGFLRQYQTLSVAIAIERRYTKDEILEMYLNSAYFGNNAFGVEAAAKNYFNKTPAELDLAESAMLIGLLPAPSRYSPIEGDEKLAVSRQAEVLSRMEREGMISSSESREAKAKQLAYYPAPEIDNIAPHFTEMVLADLYEKYGEEVVKRSGFQVKTTLDIDLQNQAVDAAKNRRAYIESMGGSNTGIVAIDPKTGQVRALVGSMDYSNESWGKVNMATASRQPGSSFKPIYFAGALADGVITPAKIYRDEAININGFSPKNATKLYYGDTTVRSALARSLNIPAVKVMQDYGIDKSIDVAKRMGITTLGKASSHGLSLAIGSAEVPLIEITGAYAAMANKGDYTKPVVIDSIADKFDKQIFKHQAEFSEAISEQGAFLISSILSDNSARSSMFGNSLTVSGKKVAVKTGTTDNNRDAWTVGFTSDIALGVWVGNNDNQVMVSGGADMAAPIWKQIMAYATKNSNPSFNPPSGIVERPVCYGSGLLASRSGGNTYNEFFLTNKLPAQGNCQSSDESEDDSKDSEDESSDNQDSNTVSNSQNNNQDSSQQTGNSSGQTDNITPTIPTNPTTPTDPTTPTAPTNPTAPTDPTAPITPTNPVTGG